MSEATRPQIGLLEGLMTNRAMRRFTDEPVDEEDIWTCLKAAVQGPSGGNIQPYQFLIGCLQAGPRHETGPGRALQAGLGPLRDRHSPDRVPRRCRP